jgi:hypothetical protein
VDLLRFRRLVAAARHLIGKAAGYLVNAQQTAPQSSL